MGRVRRRGMAGGDGRLAYFEWSVDEDSYDPGDRDAWAQANPALGIRIDEEFIAGERNTLNPVEFARERLGVGQWPLDESTGNVIPADAWQADFDPSSYATDPVAFGVEVARDRRAACVGVIGKRPDGRYHVEVAVERDGTDWVAPWLAERQDAWRPCAVVLDSSGPAGALLLALEDHRVDVTRLSTAEAKQACGGFYDAAVQGTVSHAGGAGLTGAVLNAHRRNIGDSWVWDLRAPDAHLLRAVTWAHHAFAAWDHRDYDLLQSIW